MKLTDTKLRALKPREDVYRVADGHGLALEVTPGGSKLWRYRYRWAGKQRLMALGAYPVVTLAEARDKRLELQRHLASGSDPARVAPKRKDLQMAVEQTLFRNVAKQWLEDRKEEFKPRTFQKAESIINGDLIPRLGTVSIATLTTPQAIAALDEIEARAPHMVQKAQSYLNQIVDYAIKKGVREDGRILSLRGAVRLPKAVSVPAATNETDMRQVMKAIDLYPEAMVRAALKFTALTALRPFNVVSIRWAMIDLDGCLLTIPGDEMKTGNEHFVPLPTQAIELLLQAKDWKRPCRDYVFPALSDRTTPHLHRDTLSKALRESGLRGIHVPHGFRAAFRTLAREEFDQDVDHLEAQLAHPKGNQTDRAYNRTKFLKQRMPLMQRWADYLDALIKPPVGE